MGSETLLKRILHEVWAPTAGMAELLDAHQGRSLTTKADQLIYSELDPLTEIYVLKSGLVRLFVGEGKNTKTSLFLRAPAIFGDRDILAACPVSQESARSVSSVQVLCFPREDLVAAFEDADFRRQLTADLLRRYARSIRFASFATLSLEDRILWLLWETAAAGEREVPRYQSLALLAGASSKSVGRAIQTLCADERLEMDDQRVFRVPAEAWEELGVGDFLGLFHSLIDQSSIEGTTTD